MNDVKRKSKLYSGTFIEKDEGERNRAESGFQVYGVFLVLNRIHQNGSIRSGQSLVPSPSLRSACPRSSVGTWIDLDKNYCEIVRNSRSMVAIGRPTSKIGPSFGGEPSYSTLRFQPNCSANQHPGIDFPVPGYTCLVRLCPCG